MSIRPNNSPLISIGIPTYNRSERIPNAIRSIQAQGIDNLEIIISDNGSTDNTEAVCREAMARDPRIRYFRQEENRGVAFNFSFVLQEARGTYFMWLSDDDEFIPGVLDAYIEFLDSHPEHVLVSGNINYWQNDSLIKIEKDMDFEEEKGLVRWLRYYAKVEEGALIYGLMRRRIAQRVPFWSIIGTDWHFVAGMAFQGKVKNLNIVGYNKEAGGLSSTFHKYAHIFEERWIWGYLPFSRIAMGAFAEIVWKTPFYRVVNPFVRIFAGTAAGLLVIGRYILLNRPKTLFGKILRMLHIKTPTQRKMESIQAE